MDSDTMLAQRLYELDREATRIELRAELEGRELTSAEKQRMEKLLIEYEDLAADEPEGANRKTEPDIPGRQAGDFSTHRSRNVLRAGTRDEAAMFAKRGWREWTPPKPQDLDGLSDGDFRDFSEQLRAIRNSAEGRYDKRLDPFIVEQRAGQTEGVGSEGGFLVAPRFMNEMLMSALDQAPYLGKRRIYQIRGANTIVFPSLQDEDRSSDEVAGLALKRTGEGTTLIEDQIQFRSVEMKLHKAAKLVPITSELLSDSAIGLASVINATFGRCVALLQARDFFAGTGTGEPLGIFNGSDLHDTATSTAAGSLLIADIAGMLSRLEGGGGDDSCWVMHPSTFPALAALRFSTTAGESPMFSPNISAAAPKSIYGIPYYFSDSCKTLDTVGDLCLCNMKTYLYVFSEIILDVSLHHKFDSDETTYRLKLRDAGQPMRGSTLTDRQSFTQANFVRLATRS